jgi:RNA polymerase sigma-70 factor (ECF subfamily)
MLVVAIGTPSSVLIGASRVMPNAAHDKRLRVLVEAHFDFVWRSLRALGVPSTTADDAAQRVFIIASEKLESITAGSEKAFLFSTVRGVAANARRSQQRRRESFDEIALLHSPDEGQDPEQALLDKEAKRLLEQVLEAMPDDLRNVFVLHELENLTTPTIAEVLEIPPGTVASRLRRAREEFKLSVTRMKLQLRMD